MAFARFRFSRLVAVSNERSEAAPHNFCEEVANPIENRLNEDLEQQHIRGWCARTPAFARRGGSRSELMLARWLSVLRPYGSMFNFKNRRSRRAKCDGDSQMVSKHPDSTFMLGASSHYLGSRREEKMRVFARPGLLSICPRELPVFSGPR